MNIKINIQDLKYILDRMPDNQNLMLSGKHGIGKSEILTAYFAEKNMPVIALFLGQMSDPGDLIGLPDKDGEKTAFRPPYWFPMDGKPIVLFLDELNRARPEVLQTIMDLALNRKLAGRTLPEGSRIIAAVNEGDEYQLTDLDPALVSRFNVFRFEPSVEEWLLWAKENKVDRRIIRFISGNQEWLDGDPMLEENADTGLDKTPDRRAWKRVSDVIQRVEKFENRDVKLLSGIIGVKATNLFIAKTREAKELEVADFLRAFDNYVALLANYKPHVFATLNEDIFRYLQITRIEGEDEKAVAENLSKYLEYLERENKKEVLASFAHFFQQDQYERAMQFIVKNAPGIAGDLFTYTANIR